MSILTHAYQNRESYYSVGNTPSQSITTKHIKTKLKTSRRINCHALYTVLKRTTSN